MRIRLRYRIAALTVLCLVPVVAVSSLALMRLATGYLWEEAEKDGARLADDARRATRRAMMSNEREHVAVVLQDVAGREEVRYIRLYNASGRLTISTAGPRDRAVLTVKACTRCHPDPLHTALPRGGTCSHWSQGSLRIFYPVRNERTCGGSSCHPPPERAPNLGVMEVATDLSRTEARVHEIRLRVLLWALVVLGAAATPLLFGLGRTVERPMAESLRLVEEVSRENFAVRSRFRRSDEWGRLWHAFEAMASSLGKARADLESLNRGLERQVAERTRELRSALDAAQESDRMKTEFLANISHEFSTPLQAVIGYAELLLEGIDGRLDGDQLRDVEAIHRNGERLMEWVEDLLELARLDGHTRFLCVDRIRLQDLAEEAVEAGRRLVEPKPVDVRWEAEPRCPLVVGEVGALRRVLLHLVKNAVRHTREGRIGIRIASPVPDWVDVWVEDTGPGIPPPVLQAALRGFSAKSGGGGVAMGLNLARRLVELHGGSFQVHSSPGEGTRVHLRLPAASPVGSVPGVEGPP